MPDSGAPDDRQGQALRELRPEWIAEALGLLILAADALGLPDTKAALSDAMRRLDAEAAPAPGAARTQVASRGR